jgi:hypothetical protein
METKVPVEPDLVVLAAPVVEATATVEMLRPTLVVEEAVDCTVVKPRADEAAME